MSTITAHEKKSTYCAIFLSRAINTSVIKVKEGSFMGIQFGYVRRVVMSIQHKIGEAVCWKMAGTGGGDKWENE